MKRFSLLFFVCLCACEPGKTPPPAAERSEAVTPLTQAPLSQPPEPLLEALEKAEVACEDNKKCFSDSAVLVVVARENGSIDKCSGFLVNETTVATNSQCLGEISADDCTKRVGIKFPKTYPGERKIRLCSELVAKKSEGASLLTGADFAFFKLQP